MDLRRVERLENHEELMRDGASAYVCEGCVEGRSWNVYLDWRGFLF